MTISTSSTTANSQSPESHRSAFYALWLLLPGIVIGGLSCTSRRRKLLFGLIVVMLLLIASLLSCAGLSNAGNGGGGAGGNPTTYVITITGTSGSLSHTATVDLIVE